MNIIKLTEATQGKPVWVLNRPGKICEAWCEIYATKQDAENRTGRIYEFWVSDLERFTGLALEANQCVRVRFGVMPV